jgi:threonine dehydrogenase-like Zn-dependent dehydrogenase
MRALWISGPQKLEMREVPDPIPAKNECLIAMRTVGICRTDLELAAGYMNFRGIPGHEFVGTVLSGPEGLQGRRVIGAINIPCGDLTICSACRTGLDRHCPQRTVLGISGRNGVFADKTSLPVENLFTVPDLLTDDEAVFAEPLAAALEIVEQIHIPPGEQALILGDGRLALLTAQILLLHGARVRMIGRHERKLALARRWGAQTERIPCAGQTEDLKNFDDTKYGLVIEATGSPDGFDSAIARVRPRGTIVLKSTYAPNAWPAFNASKIVVDEIRIIGSRCGSPAAALRLLAQGRVDVRSLIDHIRSFSNMLDALNLAGQSGAIKVLVRFET